MEVPNRAKRVLITGATGKTGAETVPLLLERGHFVRALVHRDDERASRLRALGAEVAVGDLLSMSDVEAALADMDAAYFVFPIDPGLLEATGIFADAARRAGTKAIVNMSQISARLETRSNAARAHWVAERIFDWSGVSTTHLRPTLFAEWLLMGATSIAMRDEYNLPFSGSRHAPIAARDQAHVIAAILADPQQHAGQTYALYGPLEMNPDEIAADLSRTLDRPIVATPTDIDAFTAGMLKRGVSSFLAQHIGAIALDYRDGIFAGTNDVVKRIGHTQATTVEDFVKEHRAAFLPRATA